MKRFIGFTTILFMMLCLFSCGESGFTEKMEELKVSSRFDDSKSFSLSIGVGEKEISIDGACFFTVQESLDELNELLKGNESFYDFNSTQIRFLEDGYFYAIELVKEEKKYFEYKLFSELSMLRLDEVTYQIPFPRSLALIVQGEISLTAEEMAYIDTYFSKCANISKEGNDYLLKESINVKDQSKVNILIMKDGNKLVFTVKG